MLTAEKRRLDSELRGLQQELENLIAQMKNSEEKARKAMGDAGTSFINLVVFVLQTSKTKTENKHWQLEEQENRKQSRKIKVTKILLRDSDCETNWRSYNINRLVMTIRKI